MAGLPLAAIGSLIGGIGQAAGGIGGLFNQGGSTPNTQSFYQNWRNDDMAWSREQFNRNEALQKEFAQSGIRWRVADAKAAGLHPLAAIGAAGSSYSPVVTAGGGSYNADPGRSYSNRDIGSSLANMGQGIGRAVAATQTPVDRAFTAFELKRQAQQLQHGDLQNMYLASQIARLQADQSGPGMPSSAGSSVGGPHRIEPYEVKGVNPSSPYAAAGPPQSENEYRYNSQGAVTSYPSAGMNIDEMGSPGYFGWMWRNRVLPFFGDTKSAPPLSQLPRGAIGWTHHFGEWHPRYPSRDFSHLPAGPSASDLYQYRYGRK